jgi:hypothetical protein
MFTFQTSFIPLLLKGEGGVKSVSRGDCEENCEDFCPNNVHKFCLRSGDAAADGRSLARPPTSEAGPQARGAQAGQERTRQ